MPQSRVPERCISTGSKQHAYPDPQVLCLGPIGIILCSLRVFIQHAVSTCTPRGRPQGKCRLHVSTCRRCYELQPGSGTT